MRASGRAHLALAMTLLLAGPVATLPGAAQSERTSQAGDSVTPVLKRNELESVLGRDVRTRVEEDMGRIVDLLADRNGRIQAAVIEFGGFLGIGTRKIAVDWSALRFEGDGKTVVIVEMTRDQLRIAPEYKPPKEPAVIRGAAE